MKQLRFGLLAFFYLPFLAQAQVDLINKVKDNGNDSALAEYSFETLIDLEATPVKDQSRSGTCWSYATTSFLESELLRKGKKAVDLSEMFTARHVYADKAEKYVRLHGHLNFAQGGALPDVLYVIKKYGAVPQSVYEGLNYGTNKNNHAELEAVLKAQLDAVIKNKNGQLSSAWRDAFEATLDAYMGVLPKSFEYEGKTYTPRSFADDYLEIDPDDYVQITSWSHFPMHSKVIIQVPDNWDWASAYNLPLDEMMNALNHSLAEGYTVAWACDVSEKGFSLKNGLAIVPKKPFDEMSSQERKSIFDAPLEEKTINQTVRQQAYDDYRTQDDHGMQITGKVRDQQGKEYYLVKNSWGLRPNPYQSGYIYASSSYLRYKTISILTHKDALPKELRKGLEN